MWTRNKRSRGGSGWPRNVVIVGQGRTSSSLSSASVKRANSIVAAGTTPSSLSGNILDYCRRLQQNDPTLVRAIDLSDKNIGDEEARALATALKTNTTLQKLDLGENQIGDKGAKALATALKSNTTLQELDLGVNTTGYEGTKALAAALKSNETLRHLSLTHNKIGSEGATALATALQANTTLRKLYLGCNRIGDKGAKALAKALETALQNHNATLTELTLDYNTDLSEGLREQVYVLGKHNKSGAGKVRVEREQEQEAHQRRFEQEQGQARRRQQQQEQARQQQQATATSPSPLPPEVLDYCRRLQQNDPTLAEIDLSFEKIGDEEAQALATDLETSTTLQKLYLCENQIGDEGATALATALKSNTTLQELDLGGNIIGCEGTTALAAVLQTNEALQDLSLGVNHIGCEGAKALAMALQTNTTLRKLYLGRNRIGDEGASALAKALQTNTTLQECWLGFNSIGDEGAKALLEALQKHNATLTELTLDYNTDLSERLREQVYALGKENKSSAGKVRVEREQEREAQQRRFEQEQHEQACQRRQQQQQQQQQEQATQQQLQRQQELAQLMAAEQHEAEQRRQQQLTQQLQSRQEAFAAIRRDLSQILGNQRQREMVPVRVTEEYVQAIQTETVLGSGFFGTVFRAYDQELNASFAIKTNKVPLHLLDKDQLERLRKTFRTELDTLHQFNHPNIVALYGYHVTDNLDGKQYLLYELAEKGALSEFWKTDLGRDRLASFQIRAQIAMGVLTAIRFLHAGNETVKHCFHRDIKSENIVIMADMTPKLIDCGLAKLAPNKGLAISTSSGGKGTDAYTCPQYQRGRLDMYKEECDIFSFGVVMVELWTGRLQNHRGKNNVVVDYYEKYSEEGENIMDGADDALDIKHPDKVLPVYAKEFAQLAVQCMSRKLKDRPKGGELLSQIQDICSRSQADTGEGNDVLKKLEKEYPSSTSVKVQCRNCRTTNVRCFPVPSSGYLCLPCLLAKTRSEASYPIVHEIHSLRNENRQLREGTHATLESFVDVLSSLDARLVNKIPSLFVLLPAEPASLRQNPRSWLKDKVRSKYRLYFVCAHSYRMVKSPIKLRVSIAWVDRVAPVLACSLYALNLAIKGPAGLEFARGGLANSIFNEMDTDKMNEMLEGINEILDKQETRSPTRSRLLTNLESGRLETTDIRNLNKEAVELVVELAALQRGWCEEMTQVRSLDGAGTKWVLNEYATRQHGYQPLNNKTGAGNENVGRQQQQEWSQNDKAPAVFLSHTGHDKLASLFVEILHEKLRKDHGVDTFLDSASLEVGVEWQEKIIRCVSNCTVFVCILSEAYFRRYWCMVELDRALESGRTIIPVCHGCTVPDVDEDGTVRHNLSAALKEKHGFVDPLTLDRWCRNLTKLKGIQGIRNKWSSKHDQVQFRDDVVATILKEINHTKPARLKLSG